MSATYSITVTEKPDKISTETVIATDGKPTELELLAMERFRDLIQDYMQRMEENANRRTRAANGKVE